MAESTEHIRSEIKRAYEEMKEHFEYRERGIERNVQIMDEKIDVAMWAIHAILRLLDEQKSQASATGE